MLLDSVINLVQFLFNLIRLQLVQQNLREHKIWFLLFDYFS